mmetsp:Transcript_13090/g.17793  ORF Transcript_13090/g.17793 Transcript_13090/m.17793 type:complete len:303 (-) Transcript_13090:27-935(-)|eukprot:CAMPEP_0201490390 /NCGR_PEP_ID=MMETSP0151_2-20130828/26531_1 /ASSEMBLY_ACC=CAM_ASM_000257 /TAXON_ID=200890 /ORGANISM="Paramoeba atlantica, Strain 621/1 / CCAP 1560/9" /LENGTH=302 /DNA_ID=CAMNT_0047876353 /DNA_START=161 /DNA_END=1069 /DNA_ORIENTATION=-
MSALEILEEDKLVSILAQLRDEGDPLDWVIIGYESKGQLKPQTSGSGALAGFAKHLGEDKVQFGILSYALEGDQYNTSKNILITWIGPEAPGGMAKARAAAHRSQLRDFIQQHANIACELQASALEELNEDMVGQAISRTRGGVYSTARSSTQKGPKKSSGGQSSLQFVDQDKIDESLKYVAETKESYAIFAYVKGKKDEVEHLLTGKGDLENLAKNWPPSDRVYFCYCSIVYSLGQFEEMNKFVLVTLIGDGVSPLARARSSGQRQELVNYIKQGNLPYHTEFQPNDVDQLKVSEVIVKFK